MRNVLRLKQIAEIIQVDPSRWNQDHFTEDSGSMTFHYKFDWDGEVKGICGTSQCIAGWAVAIDDQELFKNLSNDDVQFLLVAGQFQCHANHLQTEPLRSFI